jgi:hypothetical protein
VSNTNGRQEKCAKCLVGKSRLKWEDNIKIYTKEIILEYVDWIHLAQECAAARKSRKPTHHGIINRGGGGNAVMQWKTS